MATTFSVTRDDVINRALRICGAYDNTNPPSTTDYQEVALAFNMMIKTWIRSGTPMWKVTEVTLPLLAGQNTYQIGPDATGTGAVVTTRILKVQQAYVRLLPSQNDTPIDQLSIQEYAQYGQKNSLGVVNSMLYRPLNDNAGTTEPQSSYIKVYPTPADDNYTLRMICLVTLNDVTNGADLVDFPQENYTALCWCLADEISHEYATSLDRVNSIQGRAMKAYQDMVDWSQENTDSIRFMYDTRSR